MTGYLGNFEDGCEMTYVLICFMSFVYVRRWAFQGVCSARGAQQRSQLRSVHKLKSGGLWFLFLMLKSEKQKCWTSASQPHDVGPLQTVKIY